MSNTEKVQNLLITRLSFGPVKMKKVLAIPELSGMSASSVDMAIQGLIEANAITESKETIKLSKAAAQNIPGVKNAKDGLLHAVILGKSKLNKIILAPAFLKLKVSDLDSAISELISDNILRLRKGRLSLVRSQ